MIPLKTPEAMLGTNDMTRPARSEWRGRSLCACVRTYIPSFLSFVFLQRRWSRLISVTAATVRFRTRDDTVTVHSITAVSIEHTCSLPSRSRMGLRNNR